MGWANTVGDVIMPGGKLGRASWRQQFRLMLKDRNGTSWMDEQVMLGWR